MNDCPRDANFNNNNQCASWYRTEKNETFFCTRKKGHYEEHHSHSKSKDCRKTWEQ